MPLRVEKIINAEYLYKNDIVIAWYREIPSAANNLKSINLCNRFHTDFVPTYYNDKGDAFTYLFGKYIKPYTKEIDHPELIQEWRLNLDTASFQKILTKNKDFHQRKRN